MQVNWQQLVKTFGKANLYIQILDGTAEALSAFSVGTKEVHHKTMGRLLLGTIVTVIWTDGQWVATAYDDTEIIRSNDLSEITASVLQYYEKSVLEKG